jgi:hypothetical protein
MKHCLLFIISFIILTGCSGGKNKAQNQDSIETITIDGRDLENEADITYAIDTGYFEIIPLETNDYCLIADVSRIYLQNDKIVIYDEMAHGAYIFNRDGSYHARVRNIGNGPEEYPPDINDIMVSKNYIGVLYPPLWIVLYDFDGKFVKKLSLEGSWGMSLFTFDDINYWLVNDWSSNRIGYYLLFKLDTKQNRVYSYLLFSKQDHENNRGWVLDKYYNLYDNRALIYYSTIDTLFNLTLSGEISPRYAIDFSYKKLPDELRTGNGYTAVYSAIDNEYYKGIFDVTETSRYLFLQIDRLNYVIYDKKEKETKTISGVFRILPFFNIGLNDIYNTENGDYILTYHSGMTSFNNKEYIKRLKSEKKWTKGDGTNRFEKEYFKALEKVENEEGNPIVFIFKANT